MPLIATGTAAALLLQLCVLQLRRSSSLFPELLRQSQCSVVGHRLWPGIPAAAWRTGGMWRGCVSSIVYINPRSCVGE